MSNRFSSGCALLLACAGAPASEPAETSVQVNPATSPAATQAAYRNYAAFTRDLRAWVDASQGAATLEKVSSTSADRTVWAVQVALPGAVEPGKRPAILLVGGIDGQHVSSSEVAFHVARHLLARARDAADGPEAKLLKEHTLIVIPRANPDGVERYFTAVRDESTLNNRPVDDDRDDAIDDDGPNDLDGDGVIGVMRYRDPEGEWMVDPDEPRLLRKADRNKGETGLYRLVLEGRDDDGDGLIDEDGPGGVDLDRNWPHFFEPGVPAAGPHALSEPETRALAEFVLARPNIRAALVYGRNDNLVNVPKGQARGPSGRDYRDLHPDDVPLYEKLGEKYKAISGYKTLAGAKPEGALYAWLYSQQGLPTFAITPWWPLDAAASQPATSEPTSQTSSQPADGAEPEGGDAPRPRRGGRGGRAGAPPEGGAPGGAGGAPAGGGAPGPTAAPGGGGGRGGGGPPGGGRGRRGGFPGGGPPQAAAPIDSAAADAIAARLESSDGVKKWLKYLDERRGGAGFIPWKAAPHPTFGEVEIGGLVPGLAWNPPAGEIDSLTEPQAKFVLEVAAALPKPEARIVKIANAGGDVWEIQLRIVNPTFLPTHLAIARMIREPAFVVQPKVARERIVGGEVTERAAYVPGHGATSPMRWLIRGSAGDSITFRVHARRFGEMTRTIKLEATAPGREEGE